MKKKNLLAAGIIASLMLCGCGQTDNAPAVSETDTPETAETSAAIETTSQETTTETTTETATEATTEELTETEVVEESVPPIEKEELFYSLVGSASENDDLYDFSAYNASLCSTEQFSFGDPNAPSPDTFPYQGMIEAAKKKMTELSIADTDDYYYETEPYRTVDDVRCDYAFCYDFDNDGEKEAILFMTDGKHLDIPMLFPIYADGENAYSFSEQIEHFESYSLEKCTVNDSTDLDYVYTVYPEFFRLEGHPHLDRGPVRFDFVPCDNGIKVIEYSRMQY